MSFGNEIKRIKNNKGYKERLGKNGFRLKHSGVPFDPFGFLVYIFCGLRKADALNSKSPVGFHILLTFFIYQNIHHISV